MRLHVNPVIRSPLKTELDPRTNADNDAALSMKWSHTQPFSSFSKFSSINNGPIASTSKMSLNRACFCFASHWARISDGDLNHSCKSTGLPLSPKCYSDLPISSFSVTVGDDHGAAGEVARYLSSWKARQVRTPPLQGRHELGGKVLLPMLMLATGECAKHRSPYTTEGLGSCEAKLAVQLPC